MLQTTESTIAAMLEPADDHTVEGHDLGSADLAQQGQHSQLTLSGQTGYAPVVHAQTAASEVAPLAVEKPANSTAEQVVDAAHQGTSALAAANQAAESPEQLHQQMLQQRHWQSELSHQQAEQVIASSATVTVSSSADPGVMPSIVKYATDLQSACHLPAQQDAA